MYTYGMNMQHKYGDVLTCLCGVRPSGFLDSGFWYVEFLGFFSTNMHTYKFIMILLIIYNLDLTEEFNFVGHCGQEKRNLGYCGHHSPRGKAQ